MNRHSRHFSAWTRTSRLYARFLGTGALGLIFIVLLALVELVLRAVR